MDLVVAAAVVMVLLLRIRACPHLTMRQFGRIRDYFVGVRGSWDDGDDGCGVGGGLRVGII